MLNRLVRWATAVEGHTAQRLCAWLPQLRWLGVQRHDCSAKTGAPAPVGARRLLALLPGVLALLALLPGPLAAQQGPAASATPQPARLLVVGDSISAEYGLARGQGWVQLLSARLAKRQPPIEVINASISGETTAGGRTRLAALLQAHAPQYLLIALGGNDALRGLPLQSTRENLTAMLDAARQAQARALLVGIQVPPNYGARYSQELATMFHELGKAHDVPLVPFMLQAIAEPADLEKYFQADRIHPNAAAQPLILQTIWPTLQSLLPPP
ncbi:arylesterase [Vandammella animalimorsus]|uniref:Arylesterase n=1 Tax=Vandammella animalimorsus TaxID=2029117 RepID=A0A2A2T2V5_9BURK|nr:arylesterase [Vandammella animalimorsus]PAT31087.1 arylesterase [Vandammella animalimorsus]PAX15876.1 arylesterase [Vandammella animalimorsus]PAX17705.1 arylesterase [Vandammella animalimorsus]